MIYKEIPEVEVRDRRLHSIITYQGTAKELSEQSKTNSVKMEKDRSFSQCSYCAESCAAGRIATIMDAAVVYHAPIGCDAHIIENNIGIKAAAIAMGKEEFSELHAISTNIQEKDTIFGASEKLKLAIREADRRFHPKIIAVTTSCASGIIGEDIESIVEEMEEEIGYTIVPVYCEGFKSKIWSSGFDAAFHGILRKIVKPPQKRQKDLVNLFNFSGVDTFSPLLSGMDLKVNYLIGLASVSQLETISEAICSTSICETLSMYVAAVLEEQYGVIEVKTAAPYGIDWTNAWLREIGKITGHEEQAEKVIAEEWMKYKDEIEDLRDKLSGKKLYVFAGDSFASNLANAGKSLGLEIAGVTSLHHDVKMDNPESVNSMDALVRTNGDIPNFSICNVQPYQVIKLIQKQNPDLLLCRHPHVSSVGTKLGIPTVFEGDANQSGAYYGVVKLGRRLYEALQTGGFEKNIVKHIKLPYTDWWIKQENPFYFEGGEKNEFGN